jgi:DNA-binding response OmpR family regulator
MACLLHMLYRSHVCSQDQLDRVTEVTGNQRRGDDEGLVANRTKVAICKLRARLKKYDIELQTLWGFGYQLLPTDKEKLAKILKTKC